VPLQGFLELFELFAEVVEVEGALFGLLVGRTLPQGAPPLVDDEVLAVDGEQHQLPHVHEDLLHELDPLLEGLREHHL